MSNEPLRAWQEEAIDRYFEHNGPDFLVEATPGSGKTRFMAEIAKRLIDGAWVNRVIVVVPTTALRKQTAESFTNDTGLILHPSWEFKNSLKKDTNNKNGFPEKPCVGIVVTYAAVDSFPEIYRKFSSETQTAVFFDEIHHAGDKSSWGASLRRAFELASKRILLSGTPFRSDKDAIPFVRYVDGIGKSDVSIGYGEALRDNIVRAVYFPRYGGKMEWINKDGLVSHYFDDDLDATGASQRLRTALLPDGDHLVGMIKDANNDLQEKRLSDPDAAGVVVAMDQSHAQSIARIMSKHIGVDPVVVISDDPSANDKISTFKSQTIPWIIAVKMVSEGVDIPRLRVGVYATNVVTELFFRQFVGRVIRVQKDHDDHSAAVFIPDDQRLRKYAEEIKNQREAIFEEKDEGREGGEKLESIFVPISSTSNLEGIIIVDGEQISTRELRIANEYRSRHKRTANMDLVQLVILLRELNVINKDTEVKFEETINQEKKESSYYEQVKEWKAKNNRLVSRIHYKTGMEFNEINWKLNSLSNIQSLPNCLDLEKLKKRHNYAQQVLSGKLDLRNGYAK